jgi:parvulin-like peptidyl-prolyl isomerase
MVAAATVAAQGTPIVKVGNVVITVDELQFELQKRLPMVGFHGELKPEKLNQVKAEAKEALIVRAYAVNYATDQKIVVDGKVADADWSTFQSKNPGIAKATSEQITMLKEIRYRELVAKEAEDQAVNAKVSVSEEEAKKYYEANKGMYFQGKLFKASHIMVKVDPSEPAEAKAAKKQRAEKLFERAKSGEDFFNLAYYESDDRSKYVGGSLGSFHAGQTVAEFDSVIQKMKVGEIAGPVQTLYGYHIIKLNDVQEARQLTFEQSADKIQQRMKEEKRKKLYDEWMGALKEKYPVQEF